MVALQTPTKEEWPIIIKAFRADFGLSQTELQTHLGLSERSAIVSQWESGYRNPTSYLWLALAGLAANLRRAKQLKVPKETWAAVMAPTGV